MNGHFSACGSDDIFVVETTVIAQWSHDQGVVSLNPIGCWASLFGSLLSTLSFKRCPHGVATILNVLFVHLWAKQAFIIFFS